MTDFPDSDAEEEEVAEGEANGLEEAKEEAKEETKEEVKDDGDAETQQISTT